MNRDSLADWLAWQDSLHWQKIDLGLTRLLRVYERLGVAPLPYPVITIGGTNGKGSCVAITASILRAAGYRVGTFTSPHLVRYNERIQIDGVEVSDASLIAAFERIETVRGGETLTYFEFNTLAALLIFQTAGLDAAVLEVGMGGRLDTVNIVDADVALISSV
jgi:dihydrofolate synthase/folylpolyglutamate synthase